MAEEITWPGESEKNFPEVFTSPPLTSKGNPNRKVGQLTDDQVDQFFNKGWVLLEDFLPTDILDDAKESIQILVESLAQKLYNAKKIKDLYEGYGLYERLTLIEREFPGANIILHKLGKLPQTFKDIWSHEKLLNIAEQLFGTQDIVGHPVWNLRTKTPKNEATTVPWHQDSAYLDKESYNVLQLTAWVPLIDATPENGCLQLVENGHRFGKVAQHQCCHGGTWYVMLEEDEMERSLGVNIAKDLKTVPVPFGSVLLFSNMLPHRSLNNTSQEIRWSLDLRWQRADHSVGFHGMKKGIQMRSGTNPDWKIDWDEFEGINRHDEAFGFVDQKPDPDLEFDTTAPGPWMKRWEIVHVNRHTEAMEEMLRKGMQGTQLHSATINQMTG